MTLKISSGDKYWPAMTITDQAEADKYFKRLVKHAMLFGKSRAEAEELERGNLGYFAGYCDNATRARVEQLFKCEHPIFGAIARNGPPTQTEALAAGMIAAKSGIEMARKLFTTPNRDLVAAEHVTQNL